MSHLVPIMVMDDFGGSQLIVSVDKRTRDIYHRSSTHVDVYDRKNVEFDAEHYKNLMDDYMSSIYAKRLKSMILKDGVVRPTEVFIQYKNATVHVVVSFTDETNADIHSEVYDPSRLPILTANQL